MKDEITQSLYLIADEVEILEPELPNNTIWFRRGLDPDHHAFFQADLDGMSFEVEIYNPEEK